MIIIFVFRPKPKEKNVDSLHQWSTSGPRAKFGLPNSPIRPKTEFLNCKDQRENILRYTLLKQLEKNNDNWNLDNNQ